MEKSSLQPRSHYNRRVSKLSCTSSTFISIQSTNDKESSSSSSSSSSTTLLVPLRRQQLKLCGVRKITKKHKSQVSFSAQSYKHGLNNPLIKILMDNNPGLLAQCLAYRYYLKGRPPSDYVLSLHLQSQEQDMRSRKRGNPNKIGCSSTTTRQNNTDNAKKKQRLCVSQVVDSDDKITPFDYCHQFDEEEIIHKDMIVEGEVEYLNDVLSEMKAIKKKAHYDSSMNDDYGVSTSKSSDTYRKRNPWDDNVITNIDCDDLVWLTKQMEKDWLQFLSYSAAEEQQEEEQDSSSFFATNTNSFAVDDHDISSLQCCYKSYISMGKRNQQCDLGCFGSCFLATQAFDMHAIGRRSLGKIILKEYDLRKRVKARRIIHQLNEKMSKCSTDTFGTVTTIQQQANDFMDFIKCDVYFTSDKVIYPELNKRVEWDVLTNIFSNDTSMYVSVTSKEKLDDKLIAMVSDTFSKVPPFQWLNKILDDIESCILPQTTNDKSGYIGNAISTLQEDLKATHGKVSRQVLELERLNRLEQDVVTLIEKRAMLDKHVHQLLE